MGKASGALSGTNEGGCKRGNERKMEGEKKDGRGILQLETELCVKGEAAKGKRGYSVGGSKGKRDKEIIKNNNKKTKTGAYSEVVKGEERDRQKGQNEKGE